MYCVNIIHMYIYAHTLLYNAYMFIYVFVHILRIYTYLSYIYFKYISLSS